LNVVADRNADLQPEELNWIVANYGEPTGQLGQLDPSLHEGWIQRGSPIAPLIVPARSRGLREVIRLESEVRYLPSEGDAVASFSLPDSGNGFVVGPAPQALSADVTTGSL
jgi:hypothetical protein